MKRAARSPDVTATIASWASSFLASSLVLAVVILFVVIVVSDVGGWSREHPVGAASVVLLLACYSVSFVCLHRIQKEGASRGVPTWLLSLVAACAPLAALTYWFGAHPGVLVIGMAEVAAVMLHFVAIGILSVRKVPA
jgi:hypothetical protein